MFHRFSESSHFMAIQYIYVVYDEHPDYPGEYVVWRKYERFGKIEMEDDAYLHNQDYSNIRLALLNDGLVRIDRCVGDDSTIKETWI